MSSTGKPFFQEAPSVPDLFAADPALGLELRRRLPEALERRVRPGLAALGRASAAELPEWADQAEREAPEHIPYGAFGRRVDLIRTSGAWDALKHFAAEHRLVAMGYDEALGDRRRVVQAASLYLYSASSATFSCPLAMTDAAARVLLDTAPPTLRERLVPRLLSDEPQRFITSGQWMTERSGGSDVGGSETIARPLGQEGDEAMYALSGTKWFTSATTSEMALTLARIDDGVTPPVEGSAGLTLFCVELTRDPHGGLVGIEVNRLKDKLGTRALPTAELTLQGCRAVRLGPVGRGVATIAAMLNVTRYYNAVASASAMARAVALARDYAARRSAFGHPLSEQPLHQRTLRGLQAESAAALALCMEVADLMGRQEAGTAAPGDAQRLRALIPIAKLTLGKQAVAVTSEALECFGGAGYMEDTGLPRMLRDAQVFPIWEGTTNVLSLDVLRAEGKSGALGALLRDLHGRLAALPEDTPAEARGALQKRLEWLQARFARAGGSPDAAAREGAARVLAMTTGYLAQGILLAETRAVAHAREPDLAAGAEERFQDFIDLRVGPERL